MTQTIEQLTARVRELETQLAANNPLLDEAANRIDELEEENARLSDGVVCGDCDGSGWLENRVEGRYPCTCMTEAEPYQLLAEQLAAEQLNNKLLREALEFLNARIVSMDLGGVVERALSLSASTEALDAYVADKVKDVQLQDIEQYLLQMAGISTAAIGYWKEDDSIHPDYDTPALRDVAKLYANYESRTRQRDLAVEALEKWDMFFGGDAETAVLTIAEDPSTLTGCQKATKEAMSAIKESEAK